MIKMFYNDLHHVYPKKECFFVIEKDECLKYRVDNFALGFSSNELKVVNVVGYCVTPNKMGFSSIDMRDVVVTDIEGNNISNEIEVQIERGRKAYLMERSMHSGNLSSDKK